ncbi:cytochrome P450 [Streptomyces sp. XD-27]|uniref:cytochrome P450 n=1 Tax=Streptomyces sp. XD-27 TaxID=3062779 RepID=UPI0026F44102|nr:cytochrome P450 [Streptomyces sp. XD-27]WKX69089.1 cytochrome P450 [Streptomyces sp. XD-27]
MGTVIASSGPLVVTAPGRIPGLGHALPLLRDPLGFLASLSRLGGVVRIRLGTRPVYVVTDPALVHSLLVTHAHACPRGSVHETLKGAFGDGLLMTDGTLHRFRRRAVQPVFTQGRITRYVPVMRDVVRERIDRWRPGQVLDVSVETHHLALEIVTSVLFGTRLPDGAATAFQRALPEVVKGQILHSLYPWPVLARLPLPVNRRFTAAVAALNGVVDQVVRDHEPGSDTLLSVLRATVDPETGEGLRERDVRSEAVTMLGAGTETVSTTLAWLFHELLEHPHIHARVQAEVDEHLAGAEEFGADTVERLTYTRRVIHEVLRLHTPNAFLTRIATRPLRLGGYRVPAGTELLYSLTALHRDPARHPDPLRFDPDRPPPGSGAGDPSRHGYLPFGAGRHKCVGDTFALAELVVAAATVLSRWQLIRVPGTRAREVVWTTVQAQGLHVTVAPRR